MLYAEKLAEAVDVSREHIAKVETTKRNLSIDLLFRLSFVLEVQEYKFFIFNK